MRHLREVHEDGRLPRASKGDSFGSFSLRLGGFGFRGRWPRSLPREPFCLQTLTVVRECLLRDLVLSHCLLGIELAKCLTRIALGFGGRLGWLNPARRLCHFFVFTPISTSSRGSLSALRRLWFAWNSGSSWLSDIVCLDESGWRARRSSSSATCCSADRFGLIICFFPSARIRPGGGWPSSQDCRIRYRCLPDLSPARRVALAGS